MKSHLPLLVLDLAKVLGVAALTTLLCRRLRQPAVLGYLMAGLIVGPFVPVPLVADLGNVQTLAELGVILVLFSVGLEFDFRKLAREGVPAVILGTAQLALTTWLGYATGRALGWGIQESTLMGAALAVSSTMIIAKLFEEHGARGPLRDLVLSVGLVQDLYAILLLAGLSTSSAAAGGVGWALVKVALFLAGLFGLGGLLLPHVLRWAADHGRDETLLVATVGACFTCVVLASAAGCSPALGAFAAGMLAAGSRRARPMERLIHPLRDMFGAIFFVAVGMLLDPRLLAEQAGVILALTAVVLLGGILGGTLGAAAAGLPLPAGLRVGLTLAQPGELSFVLVGVGSAAGTLMPHALPVTVGVALLSAILGPVFFRHGDALGAALDRAVPEGLHGRLDALQGWTGNLAPPRPTGSTLAGPVAFLLLDTLLLTLVLMGAAQYRHHPAVMSHSSLALALLGAALATLGWALFRRIDQITDLLEASEKQARMLRFALLLGVGAPAISLLQPILPRGPALALGAGVLLCMGILLQLPGRRCPGSEWLLKRVQRRWDAHPPEPPPHLHSGRLEPGCPFAGRPLGDLLLALEEAPGTAVVAVQRNGEWLGAAPHLWLQAGDVVAFSGRAPNLEGVTRSG